MSQIDSSVLSFLGSAVEADVEVDEGSAWAWFFTTRCLRLRA